MGLSLVTESMIREYFTVFHELLLDTVQRTGHEYNQTMKQKVDNFPEIINAGVRIFGWFLCSLNSLDTSYFNFRGEE